MPIHITHPAGRPRERRYAYDVVFREFLGLEYEAAEDPAATVVRIDLSAGGGQRTLTVDDCLLRTPDADWLGPGSLPRAPLARWQAPWEADTAADAAVPVLFAATAAPAASPATPAGGLHIPIDIFGSVFWMLTRYEEIAARPTLDEHGRFPASAALALRENFLERPLVDEYVEILWGALVRLRPGLERKPLRYVARVTHDVDTPFFGCGVPWPRVVRGAAGDLVRRGSPLRALRRLASRAARAPGIDPADTFDFFMEQSERAGITGEFFFMALDRDHPCDASYRLDDPEIRGLMRRIHGRGHRLGLHPSYETFRDAGRTRDEFHRLLGACAALGITQSSWGGRQHFLRWRNPDTWQNWEAAGLAYDSTIGFADRVGFRAGTCREYPVFNLATGAPLALRERPLIVMECTLLSDVHMGLAPEECLRRIERLAAICRRFQGSFTLLWHNTLVVEPWQRKLYAESIEAIR